MFQDYGYMAGMHGYWWFFLIAAVVVFAIWGGSGYSRRGGQPPDTPHQILRKRLAGGEISTEEYEQRKAVLDRDS
jgi:putative membrane protein